MLGFGHMIRVLVDRKIEVAIALGAARYGYSKSCGASSIGVPWGVRLAACCHA
jgi:hypothetical protein